MVSQTDNFNPRAPCGARRCNSLLCFSRLVFQSTRPVWGATNAKTNTRYFISDFNPRAPCGARLQGLRKRFNAGNFNPRAPCGARHQLSRAYKSDKSISIHAPRVGRDRRMAVLKMLLPYFNPRAPCGARPFVRDYFGLGFKISIHAPRVGRDRYRSSEAVYLYRFQSTRPVWGATPKRTSTSSSC